MPMTGSLGSVWPGAVSASSRAQTIRRTAERVNAVAGTRAILCQVMCVRKPGARRARSRPPGECPGGVSAPDAEPAQLALDERLQRGLQLAAADRVNLDG